jgi:predicted DNA-binding transcriptional regulator AlpA
VIPPAPDKLVSQFEIAALLGVALQTVHQWRYRGTKHTKAGQFPEPDALIGRVPVWRWETIEQWATASGRWPRATEEQAAYERTATGGD